MRIGIDARELSGHPTGVGRYLAGLLHAWAGSRQAAAHEFLLYTPHPFAQPLDPGRFPPRVVPGNAGTWWEQVALPRVARQDGLDVFFSPGYTTPLRLGVPSVVAIHDVSFCAYPESYRTREGVRLRLLSRHAARRARAVITISKFSKAEIQDHLGVPGERIHVIPPGIKWGDGPEPGRLEPGRRSPEPRVLFVGSIFTRRHVPDLIRAVARLSRHRPGISLDIVGDNRTYPHEDLEGVVAEEGASEFVRWQRYVPDERLRSLYARAGAFAFLSEYEGLGLTPLEALAAGVPPVLLDTAVARESCRDAALYVPRGDVTAASEALARALLDEDERSRIRLATPTALEPYAWPRAARETLALLETSA